MKQTISQKMKNIHFGRNVKFNYYTLVNERSCTFQLILTSVSRTSNTACSTVYGVISFFEIVVRCFPVGIAFHSVVFAHTCGFGFKRSFRFRRGRALIL